MYELHNLSEKMQKAVEAAEAAVADAAYYDYIDAAVADYIDAAVADVARDERRDKKTKRIIMKSGKSGNNQSKQENRGRKKNINPSIQVSWRIPYDIYQLLEKEQADQERITGFKPVLSKVLQGIVKKSLN